MHIQNMHSLHHTGKMKNVKHIVAAIPNLFSHKGSNLIIESDKASKDHKVE